MGKFADGLKDIFSSLINKRNGANRNAVVHRKLSDEELRTMYKAGLMSKIIRLKSGYALNDTIQFDNTEDEKFYDDKLANDVKKATKFMLGFGRGIIVVFRRGDDLSQPLKANGKRDLECRVFSGDMISATSPVTDLRNERYYKPQFYNVRGQNIHWSRVIDFTYYEPVEWEKSDYDYGGISESELIYEQFINDSIVQRGTGTIVDKASTFVYKIKGYKDMVKMKRDSEIVQYVSTCEDGRSIYGGLITDADDMVEVLSQSIADLDKVDDITLRRIAMVTGLSRTDLIGEQPTGLNANGKSERSATITTITNMQSDYLQEPLDRLAEIFDMGQICFKENQGQSAEERVDYDTKAVGVAKILWEIGEDYEAYLNDKGVIQKTNWDEFWSKQKESDDETTKLLTDFMNEPVSSPDTNQE